MTRPEQLRDLISRLNASNDASERAGREARQALEVIMWQAAMIQACAEYRFAEAIACGREAFRAARDWKAAT